MDQDRPGVTRRQLLRGLAALGGVGAAYAGLHAFGLLGGGPARAQDPGNAPLPNGSLDGRRVVVIGAGLAGLCSALRLARAGAEVSVLEASGRTGGRSLTLRHGDRFAETGWDRPTEMRFEAVGEVPPEDPGNHFNAGPGRIPWHHDRVLDYCREFRIALEPFIYASSSNLMQNDGWNGGRPVRLGRLEHDLRGHLAELLAKVRDPAMLDRPLDPAAVAAFLGMLQQFGQLSVEGAALVYRGAAMAGDPRAGYRVAPGLAGDPRISAGPGEPWPTLTLDEVLASDFWRGEMFNGLHYDWQATLLQPTAGMDAIVAGFRAAAVPGNRTVGDLVATDSPVRAIEAGSDGATVTAGGTRHRADYVIATLAPKLLAGLEGNFLHSAARFGLAGLYHAATCKVGWQARSRFWEAEDRIYGGISWTRHAITQLWYPSSGFQRPTGVLTGAYNFGEDALAFQALDRPARLAVALAGGEKLHPGFRDKVFAGNGVSIAWARMPYLAGGWTQDSFGSQPRAFERLGNGELMAPRVLPAGDWYSYWSGWQEGALDSAHAATDRVAALAAGRG